MSATIHDTLHCTTLHYIGRTAVLQSMLLHPTAAEQTAVGLVGTDCKFTGSSTSSATASSSRRVKLLDPRTFTRWRRRGGGG
mmetsp:Transcript_9261/g.15364  ORF Transcript_9261/g.15364 Transcript_9261/m.15364 type:complete len:82 (-) Transcript_9261:439-684(-)